MKILRRSSSVFIAVLVVCCNSMKGHCYMNSLTFDLATGTLYNDVLFMYERPKQMNEDAIFGVILTEVHATAVLKHKNVNYLSDENRQILEEIVRLCKRIKIDGKNITTASEGFDELFRPELWNHRILWTRGELGRKPMISPGLTTDIAQSLMFEGSPKEAESDKCFKELSKESERSAGCFPPKKCLEIILRNDTTYRGYPLTHRLIYVHLSIALACNKGSEMFFEQLKKTYCTSILQDLVDIEAMNFPGGSKDLAMEQIVLCGMEGYLDFVNSHYVDLIVSWADPHGCFAAEGLNTKKNRRKKRSSSLMDNGCESHTSGMAAASLSLLIRAAVENYVN